MMIQNILVESAKKNLLQKDIPLCLELPDGRQINGGMRATKLPKLTLKNWRSLRDLIAGEIGVIGTDLVEGRVQFDGSMRQLMDVAKKILPSELHYLDRGMLARFIEFSLYKWRSQFLHSRAKDSAQIQSHYDISDAFYTLWLDPQRVYSCAYFSETHMSLAQAQEAKLDLICRKLMLKPGDRFLDIGMGWGALLLWAAQHYGVDATGITLSKNQYFYVHEKIKEKNLTSRVRIQLLDYRDVDESVPYDKVASVGMFEHVGRVHMDLYFSKIWRLMRPGGMLLNHGIAAGWVGCREVGLSMGEFIEEYIFPGGELLHVSEVVHHITKAKLELVDLENLRPHYVKTLWAWSDRLESHLKEAKNILLKNHPEDAEKIVQAYRLYLSGCAVGFERGWTSLYQMLAIRSDAISDYPFTRNHLYEQQKPERELSVLGRCLVVDESYQ
jgi:cyclopropane-fatty-acyl-phospholipid synthase